MPEPRSNLYAHCESFIASMYLRVLLPARRLAKLMGTKLDLTESSYLPKHFDYLRNGILIVQRLGGLEKLDLMKMFLNNAYANDYQMIYDVDDLITEANGLAGGTEGYGIPEYNTAGFYMNRVIAGSNLNTMKQCHVVTASTETLKTSLLDLGLKDVRLVPNRLERTLWECGNKIRSPRNKPRVVFNGGISHWREKMMLDKNMVLKEHPGDFEGWTDFLAKWIGKNWIEFHAFGDSVPFFLKDVESQVVLHPYVSYIDYPLAMRELDPDFVLCPLASNKFNKCKSDLKCLEAAALNCIPFGSVFGDNALEAGPYFKWNMGNMVKDSSDVEDVFNELMKPEKYGSVVEKIMAKKKDIWLDDEFIMKTLKCSWNFA